MTLKALRAELKKLNIDGMLIPRSDSFSRRGSPALRRKTCVY